MKKSKKLLSVFLAVVMVLSSFTVGFYAIAADEGETADTAVTDAQAAIDAFAVNAKRLIYTGTVSSFVQKHEQAVADFDTSIKAVKALTEEQKLQLDPAHYAFIIASAAEKVGDEAGKSSTEERQLYGTVEAFSEVEDLVGELPTTYQEVYDAYISYYKVENNVASDDFTWEGNEDAKASLETLADAVSGFDASQLAFSNYLTPVSGGFVFTNSYSSSDTHGGTIGANNGYTVNNLISYYYGYEAANTKLEAEPEAVAVTDFISHRDEALGGIIPESNSWRNNEDGEPYTAVDMVEAFEAYAPLETEYLEKNVVPIAEKVINEVLAIFETAYPGLTEAINSVVESGMQAIEDPDGADIDALEEMVASWNSVSNEAKDAIANNSSLVLGGVLNVPMQFDAETDAATAYHNAPSYTKLTVSAVISQVQTILDNAKLNEFNEKVNSIDVDSCTAEEVAEVQALYASLGTVADSVSEEVFDKFVQIITPIKDTTDFADEIAAFQPADFVRPTNSKVAWTEGGIQSFVDKLGGLVGSFVNLNDILSDNLYQVSIIKEIFNLYASLSHNETQIEAAGLSLSLKTVVGIIVNPTIIANNLVEDKFAGAVEKIKGISLTEEDEAAGTTLLDKLAATEFTAEDFGFKNGDREGFINALLAVLRPITTLLDPDGGISIAGMSLPIGIKMFGYTVGADGSYNPGVYEQLLPLFEQLGMNDLPTAEEYETNYYNVKEKSGAAVAADEFLRPIIDSLLTNVVDPIVADPLNGLIDILPRLAYVVDGDRLNTYIKGALSQLGMLSGLAGSLDLSTAAINNLIPDSIDVGALIGDGTELVLNIGDLPWSTLANCATLSAVPSSTIYNEYTLLRTGETDSCISTVMYFLYDVALADDATYNAIKTLVKGVVPDNLSSLIDGVFEIALNPAHDAGNRYDGYGLILDNSLIGGTPTGNEIWRVNAAAGEGGTITPSGDIAVKQADSRTFAITANDGYTISSLTVNGTAVADAAGKTAYDYTVSGADVTSADPANQNTTDLTIAVTFADESGEPAPGPDEPSDPSNPSNPSDPGQGGNNDSGSNNGGSNNGGSSNTNKGSTLPLVDNNNPNLPNTGAQEIAGMSVITVVIALAAGMIVWFILRKRIAE